MEEIWSGTGRNRGRCRGQSTLEFTFAAFILLLLVYGLVQSVRWVIMDAADRRYYYEQAMGNLTGSAGVDITASEQLNPQGPKVYPPDLEYRGNVR